MMRGAVAVVGGSGFIGRHLVNCLEHQGVEVRVMGLHTGRDARTASVTCDVRDEASLVKGFANIDVVYNLAAVHGGEDAPASDFEDVNVRGARNVCAAAAKAGVSRIIFTSSAAVYGHGDAPDETVTPRPAGTYGRTKLEAEAVYRTWAASGSGRRLVIVRPTVVIGAGATGTGGSLLRWLAGPEFAHVGNGGSRKSLACVGNLAAVFVFFCVIKINLYIIK
jgi:nucleoside-diphosphate-sugar epimerase